MKIRFWLLAVSLLSVSEAFALSESNHKLFENMTALMKEEIQQQKVKDRDGNEIEDPGRGSILLNLRNTAEFREKELESNLSSVMAHFETMKVKEAATQLRNELIKERLAKETAEVTQIQTLLDRAAEAVKTAKTPEDLDGILVELGKSRDSDRDLQNFQKISQLVQQAEAMKTFVAQWQDYIAATKVNNYQAARQALNYLVSSSGSGQVSIFPRSEIIALAQALDKTVGDPVEVVLAIKTLDEIAPAIEKVRKAQEIRAGNLDYTGVLADLATTEKIYRDYLGGLPYILTGDYQRIDIKVSQVMPKLVELRVKVLKLVLPRYLDAPKDFTALENETVNEFLDRIGNDAKAREDLDLLSRVSGAKRNLVRSAIENNDDVAGLRLYAAGRNQERAGQFEFATASYQEALKTGSDVIPSEKIGERLQALKLAHPKEYQKGLDRFGKAR
jgi:hypothetical protein